MKAQNEILHYYRIMVYRFTFDFLFNVIGEYND